MKTSVFLVGLGSISLKYDLHDVASLGRTHARAIERHSDFDLSGGYDPSEASRIDFSNFYKKPAFAQLEIGLKQINPEVIVIASPTDLHSINLQQVLAWCNPKVILCEKPIATDVNQINTMIESCEAQGVKLFVNYFRNSEPSSLEISDAIARQVFQEPYYGICTYNKGAYHTATHFLNLFELWFGEAITTTPKKEKINAYDPRDPNYEFQAIYQGGTIDFQVASDSDTLAFHSEIQFSNGLLQYKNEGEEIFWVKSNNNEERGNVGQRTIKTYLNQGIYNVWDEISNLIDLNAYNLCSAERAKRYILQIDNLKRNMANVK